MIHGVSPPRFWRVARPGTGAGGLSMTQRTCVGGKITPCIPNSATVWMRWATRMGNWDGVVGRKVLR